MKTQPVERQMGARTLIIYHANCIDGITSAWVAWSAVTELGGTCDVVPMRYNKDLEAQVLKKLRDTYYSTIYIVDFSIPLSALKMINRLHHYTVVTLIDHHKTAFELYDPGNKVTPTSKIDAMVESTHVVLDNDECGASLCWRFFYGNKEWPNLISYVKDYDLWRFKFGDETKHINKFLRTYLPDMATWGHLAQKLETIEGRAECLSVGEGLQQHHDQRVEEIASGAQAIEIGQVSGLSVECPEQYVSDVGHLLAKKVGTFGAMYRIDEKAGCVDWSLRSNKDSCDVERIAKIFGGGGHKNAAGFKVDLVPGSMLLDHTETSGLARD